MLSATTEMLTQQIPPLKISLVFNFFSRSASSMELSPARNQILSQPLHFHELPKLLWSLIKKQFPSPVGNLSKSDAYTLYVQSPWTINKIIKYRVRVCGDVETVIHPLLHCNVHSTIRAQFYNNVRGILAKRHMLNVLSVWATFHLLLLLGVPDALIRISVAVFSAVGASLKSCNRFWLHSLWFSTLFL